MKDRLMLLALLMCVVSAAAGCVERKMLIRSEPAGAPVWIDEVHAGATPLDYPFQHYGRRRIRVGPIRDENQKVQFRENERVISLEAPWYEWFPIDFIAEVLWPLDVVDEHSIPFFELESAEAHPELHGKERSRQVLERATEFRERALYSMPEELPEE